MPDEHLLYHVENNTARITINREQQRNAITPEAIKLFLVYLDRAEQDTEVRAVLITGASTGLGAATAVLMAEAGADVGINYCHSKRAAQGVARKVEKLGRRALLLECDVRDPDQVNHMVGTFVRHFRRLDVLFHSTLNHCWCMRTRLRSCS